jgi:alkanesulfonate monooxygenase SsuD/methylene tetrahydromethanopterin reductase-like flavin-dependent oxidoreductase (luciferase family)
LTANGAVAVAGAQPPKLLVSALGSLTLRIAGELTDGTITNWAGPATLADHVVPTITRAAAGRPRPQIVAMVMVCVTDDEAGIRRWVADKFGLAGQLVSYRAMLDREGVNGVEDMVLAGDERSVERQLRRQVDAGVTEFAAVPLGSAAERKRTIDVLADLQGVVAG